MRSVIVASLRTHLRRYVAAALAVVASVTFVVVAGVITAGARGGAMESMYAPFRNADYVVDDMGNQAAIELVERLGANASPIGRASPDVRAGDRLLSVMTVGPINTTPDLRWQTLVAGRFPAREGEAVVDRPSALEKEIAIGDRLRIGEGAAAADIAVVGIVNSPSTGSMASVYVTFPQLLSVSEGLPKGRHLHLGHVAVRGDVGPLPASAAPGTTVQPVKEFVDEAVANNAGTVNTLALILLLFAGVALFVSALVISNTFAILFARRIRDFALLRCVGATRRQVLRSVRQEALAVGVLASLAGVLVGTGLGYGLVALIKALTPAFVMGAAELPTLWLLGGFAAGVAVTMVASWLPTRRVVRVSPLAALRPAAAIDVRTATGRIRLALTAFLLVAGLVLLGVAMVQDSTPLMLAGGGAVFAGVLLCGPVLVPRLIRVVGALLGPAGRLATENAVRNPRRTAATAASLLVGITLTTAALTGMATMKAGSAEELAKQLPIDVALTLPDRPVTDGLLDQVRRTPGVANAVAVGGVVAEVAGLDDPIPVVTAPAVDQVARDGGAFARVQPGTMKIDPRVFIKLDVKPGDRVTVSAGGREVQVTIVVDYAGRWGQIGVVAPETLATLTDSPEPHVVWIRAAPGVDPILFGDALDAVADQVGAEIDNGSLRVREGKNTELLTATWAVVGLLGISVAIALVGIANTLGLSVLERAREHALLRALGLTRRQLRRMLAAEAVLLSVVATGLGTVIGVGFAWVGYETFMERPLPDATLRVPWLQLGAVVIVAALAGLLASVLPARRAAQVTPAAGLSLD